MNPDGPTEQAGREEAERPPKANELTEHNRTDTSPLVLSNSNTAGDCESPDQTHKKVKTWAALPILMVSEVLSFVGSRIFYLPLSGIAQFLALALLVFVLRGPRRRYGLIAFYSGAYLFAIQLFSISLLAFTAIFSSSTPAFQLEVTLVGITGVGIAMYLLVTWARNESMILVPLALAVMLISTSWAWRLAAGQFANAPVMLDPGAVVVGTYGPSANPNGITVNVRYKASINQASTNYTVDFSQRGEGESPEIAFFLCGAAAENPSFTNVTNETVPINKAPAVKWYSGSQFNSFALDGQGFQFPNQCIFALIPLVFYRGSDNNGAVLMGHSGPPPSKVSGAEVSYAWPGILALTESEEITDPNSIPPETDSDFTVNPLMTGSSYTISVSNVPDDLSNVVTNPDITLYPWGYGAAESFNAAFTEFYSEFRLSGNLSNSQAAGQRNLFIAGALVGVAGGAVIWFLELLTKTLLAFRKSSESETAQAQKPG